MSAAPAFVSVPSIVAVATSSVLPLWTNVPSTSSALPVQEPVFVRLTDSPSLAISAWIVPTFVEATPVKARVFALSVPVLASVPIVAVSASIVPKLLTSFCSRVVTLRVAATLA